MERGKRKTSMAQTGAGGGMAADGRCGGAARACDAGAAGACGHDAGAAGGRGRRSASGRGIGKSQSPAGAFVKHYVDVIMRLRDDGRIVPLSVCWDDGRTFHIDQVLDGPISNAPRSANRRTLHRVAASSATGTSFRHTHIIPPRPPPRFRSHSIVCSIAEIEQLF